MSQYSVALVVNHQTGVAGLGITKENGKRPGQYRQHNFSVAMAERIATADGKYKLDNPELNGANDTAAVWVQDVQHEFFRRLVARDNQLIFNGGVVYDAKDSRTHSIKGYGDRTGFLTGLVHSTRIMLSTFNEFQGWFESETQCLAPIYRARYPRSTKAPTGEDLKFLREELEAAKWRFCPDVYGNGVYVFAGEIVGDC